MQRTFILIGVCLSMALHSRADAQCFDRKLYESPPSSGSNFGRDMDLDEDILAVSSLDAVSIYRHDGTDWQFEQRLTFAGIDFGESVSVSGDWLLVGAPSALKNGTIMTGGAMLYEFDGDKWRLHQLLFPDDDSTLNFGSAVAIDGSLAAVGAPQSGFGSFTPLAVYRDRGELWKVEQVLEDFHDGYGGDIALSEQHSSILVGTWQGSALLYEYDLSQWQETAGYTLFTISGEINVGLGSFTSGEPLVAISSPDGLAVTVHSGTTFVDSLSRSSTVDFGHKIDVDGHTIATIDQTTQAWPNQIGAGYVYECDINLGCELERILYALSPQQSSIFSDVAIHDDTVVLSDELDDGKADDAGVIYSYDDDTGFRLFGPLQGKAGTANDFVTTCGGPDSDVELYYGTTSGVTTVTSTCAGLATLDIANAQLAGSFSSDGNGNAYPNLFVSHSAQGQQYIIQAVSSDSFGFCIESNTVTATFD